MTYWPLGLLDRAAALADETIIRAVETRHIPTIAYAHCHVATFETVRRDHQRAAPQVEVALGLAQKYGMPVWTAFGTFHDGWVRCGTVDREAGIREMHEGMTLMRLQHRQTFMPLLTALLAEAEAEAGRSDDVARRQSCSSCKQP